MFLTHERGHYLGIGLRAVILATMMLSGRGVATALKVPFQNFSNSCFSPCCRLAILKAQGAREPGALSEVLKRGFQPDDTPWAPGRCPRETPEGWGGEEIGVQGGGWDRTGRLRLDRQRRKKVVPGLASPLGLALSCAGSRLSSASSAKQSWAGFLYRAENTEEATGASAVRARVSSGAPGFCLLHNVTLEGEAGRASCTFLPPLLRLLLPQQPLLLWLSLPPPSA